jgi:hypothetical protein
MNHSLLAALSCIALIVVGCAAGAEKASAPGVLRHVVLLKFKDDALPEQIRQVESEFRALKNKIPGVQALEWGTNVSPEGLAQGFTHCFFVTFPDSKTRDAYLPHAAHQDFVKILRSVLDKVLVVDYVAKD